MDVLNESQPKEKHMNRSQRILASLLFFSITTYLSAQMTVSGTVTDAGTGSALAGANVVVDGTNNGAAADANGAFTINNVPNGATLTASMIGYSDASMAAARTVNFNLSRSALEMTGLEVIASRADERTPVAYTTVTAADMEARLGSQDLPMALNTTPSVYATQQGGGAGDARINVRGFNQRNVAVMINGVPQNDMENGWVYWSNWDGVADASHSIQMQRGLSAVNLATPSIGGTMNIITNPAAQERGGRFKQELGAGSFLKTTINYNTGLMGNLAVSANLVRKTGEGVIDKTWTDAWAYYLGASYQMNETNRFELYAVGAPQRHGQNLYRQNIASYSQELAGEVDGYDATAFTTGEKFETEAGRNFNQNWGPVSSDYKGKQYWYMYGEGGLFGGGLVDRHSPDFLNERENFFHKPLVNLNHYLTINDQMRVNSILYWSGGSGGGTGTYGSVKRFIAEGAADQDAAWWSSSPWTWDWNGEIAENSANIDSAYSTTENRSTGILRNSINRQNTIGAISKLNYDLNEDIKLQFGLDWRTAGIEHAREVRDLLGGDYYIDSADDNDPDKKVGLGDIIAYHNSTTVDWLGFFGQGSYNSGPISAYGMAGFSQISYTYQDHFTVANAVIDHGDAITAMQFKGGAMYDLNENMSLFANYGLVEKPPIMDNVIYYDGTVASDPANEKFTSLEGGVNYNAGNMSVKAGYYMTNWKDRNLTKSVTTGQGSSGDTDVIFLTGVNQDHSGLELQASMQVIDMLRLDASLGMGTWKFVSDATGNYQEYTDSGAVQTTYTYALKDLFVGDMPQTGMSFGATLTPISGLSVQALFNYYDKNYSDWSPDAREVSSDGADREQVWMAPSYSKLDLHVNFDLTEMTGMPITAFAHVFNALDDLYVQDATDNSQYNSYGDKVHAAHNAEVFLGTPRYFNLGLTYSF
jgi:iron complex outermembrane receptor protein